MDHCVQLQNYPSGYCGTSYNGTQQTFSKVIINQIISQARDFGWLPPLLEKEKGGNVIDHLKQNFGEGKMTEEFCLKSNKKFGEPEGVYSS